MGYFFPNQHQFQNTLFAKSSYKHNTNNILYHLQDSGQAFGTKHPGVCL